MKLAAVILAGGRGERLGGVIKANLRFANRRLLDHVDDRLAGVDTRLLSIGRHDASGWQVPTHYRLLPDLPLELFGPLAGLAAAVAWARQTSAPPDAILLAPVDSPLLPQDMLPRLVDGLETAPAAIAAFDGQPYPTSSLWRLPAIAGLPEDLQLPEAPRSLLKLARRLGAAEVPFPPAPDGGDPFANINSLADLLALERRARRP